MLSKKAHEIFSLMKQLIEFLSPMVALKIRGSFTVIRNVRKSEGHVHEDIAAKGDQRLKGPSGSCGKGAFTGFSLLKMQSVGLQPQRHRGAG